MANRLSYEFVKTVFEKGGCQLLSTVYKNAHTKMSYRCNCGKLAKISYNNFKKGRRCVDCGGTKKLTINQILQYFNKMGCALLETNYHDCRTPMRYICRCKRKSVIRWDNFKRGQRCKQCHFDSMRGKGNPRWNPDRIKLQKNQKLKKKYYAALYCSLHSTGKRKNQRSSELLGYSSKELQQYIESHHNWSLVKDKRWSLDHIFPIKAFVDYGIDDSSLINALDNLQPILHTENCSKKESYDINEFEQWISRKGIN